MDLGQIAEKMVSERYPGLAGPMRDNRIEDAAERLENFLNIRILESLPESKLEEFEELMDADDDTSDFLRKYIPDFDQKVSSAVMAFMDSYLKAP